MNDARRTAAALAGARDASPFLDADTIMAIAGLVVRARCVAEGVLAGLHRSRRQGQSAEFVEHKVYAPGDDIRRVDWKAFGKLDRYYVKQFEEEAAVVSSLVVDTSGSMAYPEQGRHTKYAFAATLAASLAHLLLHQSDPVGLLTFATGLSAHLPPRGRGRQLDEIAGVLERAQVGGPTAAGLALKRLGELVQRRARVVVFSDLLGVVEELGDVDALFRDLGVLRARGADVSVLQVLDPDELDLPFRGIVHFYDLEADRDVQVDAGSIRDSYKEELRQYLTEVEAAARQHGVDYQLVRTDASPVDVLVRFVASRFPRRRS